MPLDIKGEESETIMPSPLSRLSGVGRWMWMRVAVTNELKLNNA